MRNKFFKRKYFHISVTFLGVLLILALLVLRFFYQRDVYGQLTGNVSFVIINFTFVTNAAPTPPTLSLATNQCVDRPGTDDNRYTFQFTSAEAATMFHLDRDGTYFGSTDVSNPYMDVFLSPGESHTYNGRVRTASGDSAYSNSITVTGADCSTPPPPPVPGPFTLNAPTTFCSGANSHVRLSWTASVNGPSPSTNSGYLVYIDGVYKYNALHSLTLDDPEAKNYGQSYKYKIEALVIPGGSTFSNEQTVVAQDCSPPPQIGLWLNTPTGRVDWGGSPAKAKQLDPVTLNWNISYAQSCTTTSGQPFWNGALSQFSGSNAVDVSQTGSMVFYITCFNPNGSNSASIQLNVNKLGSPYFQTTGGDVHSNETIYITP